MRIIVPLAGLIALAIYSAFPRPTHDQAELLAIATASRQLIAEYPVGSSERAIEVPPSRWPPAIARLRPFMVIVGHGMVDIPTKPFFDGGWGYGFAPDKQSLPMLVECWSDLGHQVYWHGPC